MAKLNLHWECSFITVNATIAQGYVFTGVCHSVHRGACIPACTGQTPPGKTAPVRHPHWADIATGQTPPGQAPPPSVCWDTPPYPVHAGIHPPAATAADGTHPTGMHSSFICNMNRTLPLGNPWAATLKGVFVGNGRTWRIYMYGNIHPISIIMYNHISCINLKMHADFQTIR